MPLKTQSSRAEVTCRKQKTPIAPCGSSIHQRNSEFRPLFFCTPKIKERGSKIPSSSSPLCRFLGLPSVPGLVLNCPKRTYQVVQRVKGCGFELKLKVESNHRFLRYHRLALTLPPLSLHSTPFLLSLSLFLFPNEPTHVASELRRKLLFSFFRFLHLITHCTHTHADTQIHIHTRTVAYITTPRPLIPLTTNGSGGVFFYVFQFARFFSYYAFEASHSKISVAALT